MTSYSEVFRVFYRAVAFVELVVLAAGETGGLMGSLERVGVGASSSSS